MSHRKWLALVAAVVVCSLAGFLLLTAFVVRLLQRPDYMSEVLDPLILVEDVPFAKRTSACDILIYGDSSAMTGIEPQMLADETHMNVCNIAIVRDATTGAGTFALDHFLAVNGRPRAIVFEFAPDFFFHETNIDRRSGYAPWLMLLRHRGTRQALWSMLRFPQSTVRFVFYTLRDHFTKQGGLLRVHRMYDDSIYEYTHGLHAFAMHQEPLTACTAVPDISAPFDPVWIANLRARYSTADTVVLVRASAIPACDPDVKRFRSLVARSLDGGIPTLPVSDFVEGGRHFTLDGARRNTEMLNQLLRSKGVTR